MKESRLPTIARDVRERSRFAKATADNLHKHRRAKVGGPQEDRTPDLRIANAALSQLS